MIEKEFIQGKRRARKLAVQALYQWLMAKGDMCAIEAQYLAEQSTDRVDANYFHRLLHGVEQELSTIETTLLPYLVDRAIHEVNPIELTVLRIGVFELLYVPETPYKVILDEAVTLAKMFGSQEGHRYVNGVLNNLAKQVRVIEIGRI